MQLKVGHLFFLNVFMISLGWSMNLIDKYMDRGFLKYGLTGLIAFFLFLGLRVGINKFPFMQKPAKDSHITLGVLFYVFYLVGLTVFTII
ncbi:hypothetical protein A8F94_14850 [Bacillus sp. FJAT-27225]|uniref:hypothetical protein n=1 Tax=Bacillus sp. FJAT-27225 TaxID=1743144 RepID=UPI00080C26C0|nr:hypothetical protein [Bacillus sp. FJAT-27225]OCA84012.1 hypothetical protein A8F94_14850 [Bacillus sp. FJAT-27225]